MTIWHQKSQEHIKIKSVFGSKVCWSALGLWHLSQSLNSEISQ